MQSCGSRGVSEFALRMLQSPAPRYPTAEQDGCPARAESASVSRLHHCQALRGLGEARPHWRRRAAVVSLCSVLPEAQTRTERMFTSKSKHPSAPSAGPRKLASTQGDVAGGRKGQTGVLGSSEWAPSSLTLAGVCWKGSVKGPKKNVLLSA